MPVFEYKATDLDASAVGGTIIADTPRQARDQLRDRGLSVVRIRPMGRDARTGWLARRRGRGTRAAVVEFVRELATLTRVGIPLLEALDTCIRQHGGALRAVLQQIRDQVAAGKSLAEAMGEHPGFFDEMCVSIVQVGENTGTLDESLARLADFKEKAQRLRSRVLTALIYPAIVLTVGLAVTVFLMTYVVPNLLATLADAGRPLPAATRWVQAVSNLLVDWWWALLGGAAIGAAALRGATRTPTGRRLADRLLLRVPLVGPLVRKENTGRLAVVLAALLRSGLEFVQAVRVTRRTLRNRAFRDAMEDYERAVTAGRDIAGPLEASGVFSPMVVQILAIGQQSGELEEMLEQLAETCDHQVATAAARLTAMLEPLLIVLLAVLVGFVAFATILPILEASNVLG